MANPHFGEHDIKLNGISYTLRITMDVIAKYEDAVNSDFIADAYSVADAFTEALAYKAAQPLRYAKILTQAVSLNKVATLVYLAAKATNSQVEFGEIQEAFLVDRDISDDMRFHPAIFLTLAMFALNGKEDKKKDSSKAGYQKSENLKV